MKYILTIFIAAAVPVMLCNAQNQNNLDAQIEEGLEEVKALASRLENECFPGFSSKGLHDNTGTKDGRTYTYKSHEDFVRTHFQITTDDFTPEEKKRIPDISKISKWFNNTNNSFHILAHGAVPEGERVAGRIKIGGESFTAAEFAPVLMSHLRNYQLLIKMKEEPLTVVVHSCYAGSGQANFAQELADILGAEMENVRVVAPSDLLWFATSSDRDGKILNERVLTEKELRQVTKEKVGGSLSDYHDSSVAGKNWRVFQKGKAPEEGLPDAGETVKAINDRYFRVLEQEYREGKRFLTPTTLRNLQSSSGHIL